MVSLVLKVGGGEVECKYMCLSMYDEVVSVCGLELEMSGAQRVNTTAFIQASSLYLKKASQK